MTTTYGDDLIRSDALSATYADAADAARTAAEDEVWAEHMCSLPVRPSRAGNAINAIRQRRLASAIANATDTAARAADAARAAHADFDAELARKAGSADPAVRAQAARVQSAIYGG